MAGKTHRIFVAVAAAAVGVLVVGASFAQQSGGETKSPAAYRPGLGDLMTTTIQPRHLKLGLAGREKNWAYAAYELRELNEAFGRIAQVWPQWQSMPIPDMMRAALGDPMATLAQAIKNGNAEQFAAAYGQLTDGCNACHQSADRAFVVIQPPRASSYPDQDFTPKK
jgi:HAMP domain-containing protein